MQTRRRPTGSPAAGRRTGAAAVLTIAALAAALSGCADRAVPLAAPPSNEPSAPVVETTAAAPTEPCVYVARPPVPGGLPEGWSQEKQDQVLTWALPIVGALGLGEDGFRVGYAPPTVTVLTKEPLPASLDTLIADAAAAGVAVVWLPTRYDQRELEEISSAFFDALRVSVANTTVGPSRDAAGLNIYSLVELDDAGCAEVRRIAEELAPGVPLSFEIMGKSNKLEELE